MSSFCVMSFNTTDVVFLNLSFSITGVFLLLVILANLSLLCAEASAKTKDGVQCAFEELVEKILQTPGLWESEHPGQKLQLNAQQQAGDRACGGYCSIP